MSTASRSRTRCLPSVLRRATRVRRRLPPAFRLCRPLFAVCRLTPGARHLLFGRCCLRRASLLFRSSPAVRPPPFAVRCLVLVILFGRCRLPVVASGLPTPSLVVCDPSPALSDACRVPPGARAPLRSRNALAVPLRTFAIPLLPHVESSLRLLPPHAESPLRLLRR